jgi:hypothetical protein
MVPPHTLNPPHKAKKLLTIKYLLASFSSVLVRYKQNAQALLDDFSYLSGIRPYFNGYVAINAEKQ